MAKLVMSHDDHDYCCNDLKGHNGQDHDDPDHDSIQKCETHDRLYYLSQIALCWPSTYPSLRPTPTGVLTNSYNRTFECHLVLLGVIRCFCW